MFTDESEGELRHRLTRLRSPQIVMSRGRGWMRWQHWTVATITCRSWLTGRSAGSWRRGGSSARC